MQKMMRFQVASGRCLGVLQHLGTGSIKNIAVFSTLSPVHKIVLATDSVLNEYL